jgi:hypothetical protein
LEALKALRKKRENVFSIPNGENQETVYRKIRPIVTAFNEEQKKKGWQFWKKG